MCVKTLGATSSLLILILISALGCKILLNYR
jgi:hypothetical protein